MGVFRKILEKFFGRKNRKTLRERFGRPVSDSWPPLETRGRWFSECVRLERFLSAAGLPRIGGAADRFLDVSGSSSRPEWFCVSLCVVIGNPAGELAATGLFESCRPSLEESCRGFREKVLGWLFGSGEAGLPSSEEELELGMAVLGI